jgi:hypothetical protein
MLELITLALFLAGGWFWVDSMHAREAAVESGRRACEAEQVQLLDWSVALKRIRVGRDGDGRLRFRRTYEFEFSDTGDNRLTGSVTLLGQQVLTVHMPLRQDPVASVVRLH